MKLTEYIKQQEDWARELRGMAEAARAGVDLWKDRASKTTDPLVRRECEANAKGRVSFAARFEHMAAEVEADIARLRKMDDSDHWSAIE